MHITSLLRRLSRDTSGVTVINFALAMTAICGCVGGAIDYNRWSVAKRVTSAAVDAAVLAGARSLQLNPGNPTAAINTATAYFLNNISGKANLHTNTIAFVTADANKAITATGAASIKTTLLGVLGFNELPVMSAAGAGFPKAKIGPGGTSGSNIEIALMLDVTGSMCDVGLDECTTSTKLDGLKAAAKNLIDTVIPDNQSGTYTSKVSLIPFSTRVRVGPDGAGTAMMKKLTDLDATWNGWYNMCTESTGGGGSEGGGNWECLNYQAQQVSGWKVMPCVTDRFYNSGWVFDATEAAPGNSGSGTWLNAHDGGRMTKSWDSSSTTPTSQRGLTSGDPADHWNYNDTGECADVPQANEMMPLSSNKTQLKARIDGLEAFGSTAGALGTAWAWYTLSPEWDNVWTGTSVPGAYADLTNIQGNGKPLLRKVAILMTDGVYNTYRGWKDQDQQQVSDYAKQLCTNMKAQGIEIFTVGLALDLLSPGEKAIAEDTLQSCGTDVSHFYSTLNVTELQAAFDTIANSLGTITLTR